LKRTEELDPDPHLIEQLDLDTNLSKKLDPDPDQYLSTEMRIRNPE
jgi:hypothetical protein